MAVTIDPGDIDEFLRGYENKELLRFVTIGSVDDGKSTLIGRLLYESGGIFEDQLAAVTSRSADGTETINFANLTDGLQAEREQGITIDVAYRYSSTRKRKFIIADTPGHVQYTRNMATGASTAHAAIILIDARLGVLQQSRRHAYIANLLRIPHLLVAVNKMDLVDFDQATFDAIRGEFAEFLDWLQFEQVTFFPVSALLGDNIVRASERTPWYGGKPLLDHLETLPIPSAGDSDELMFPVQIVLRPNLDFRGFAGTLASGHVCRGQEIKVLPSGHRTRVKSIVTAAGDADEAFAPMSVCLTLEHEIDISRGDVFTTPENRLHVSRRIDATLVWMSETPLDPNRQYLVKHTTNVVAAAVEVVRHRIDMDTLESQPVDTLVLNDVGRVTLSLARPLVLDLYQNNHTAGSFILVDRLTNATVAAGMIWSHGEDFQDDSRVVDQALTARERAERFGQRPTVIWMTGRPGSGKIVVARRLERRLFDAGHMPYVIDPSIAPHVQRHARGSALDQVLDYAAICAETGLVTIVPFTSALASDRARAREILGGQAAFLEVFFAAETATCRSRLEALGRDPAEAETAYEDPEAPDLTIDGDELDIDKAVDRLVKALEGLGLVER